ncbi:hypothetical protein KW783_02450 [Candidatus Parcubacteria bacterium]|nr:hypothetical protein [Candidatus Parcubacteria bacterium]
MKVVLVAMDVNPSNALLELKKKLEDNGHTVTDYIFSAKGRPISTDEFRASIVSSDIVLCGMSSSKELANLEMAAAELAIDSDRTLAFYVDARGGYGKGARQWFDSFKPYADIVFIQRDDDVTSVSEQSPNATICVASHPKYEKIPLLESRRDEIRRKLNVENHEVMIVYSGSKIGPVNREILGFLNNVGGDARFRKFRIFFSPHPGDKNDLGTYPIVNVGLLPRDVASGEEILAAGDVYIHNMMSTMLEAAMYLRKIAICIQTPAVREARSTQASGELPRECEEGVAFIATSEQELQNLLLGVGTRSMDLRVRQQELYPAPPPVGTSVAKMTTAIEKFVIETRTRAPASSLSGS